MIREHLYIKIGEYAAALKDYPNTYDSSDPDNREKLICKNMRLGVDLAVKAAVKYNLSDEETDDVISQGLLGVAVAWDKYDPSKCDLRSRVIDALPDKMSGRRFQKLLDSFNSYGSGRKFDRPHSLTYTKDELVRWCNANIPTAKFSSVAYMWANAYVQQTIKDILERRSLQGELDHDVPEQRQRNQEKWEQLFDGIGETDLYILQLRHGLAGDKPMTYRDIAKKTGFQIAVVKKAVETAFNAMKENALKYGIKWGDIMV